MKKLFFLLPLLSLLNPPTAHAVCPVCTVAVVGGLGISRSIGVDDTVASVWVGGLILSSSFWLREWLAKREKFKRFANIWAIALLMYALVLIPLYFTKTIGIPFNTLWGIDKIIFGTFIGSVVFLKGIYLDKLQRKQYGKQFFAFQKVVFPVSMLIIASLVFYFITK